LSKEFSLVESRRLDALRGLAALAVVVVHQGQIFRRNALEHALRTVTDLGKHGVAIFFILSGYLLARNLTSSPKTYDSYRKFMARRFFRIYPAYLFTLLWLTLCTNVDRNSFFLTYFSFILLIIGFLVALIIPFGHSELNFGFMPSSLC